MAWSHNSKQLIFMIREHYNPKMRNSLSLS
jgi:hypothetical protein